MLASAAAGARNAASTLDEPLELAACQDDGGVGRSGFVLGQRVERRADAAEQPVRVGEPIALGSKALRLAIDERERFELGDLKTQQLDLGLPLRARGAPVLELLDERLPRRETLGDRGCDRRDVVVGVEQGALVAGVEQRLVRVLTVDVDEQAAERLQVLES